jgi:hypothetical protein
VTRRGLLGSALALTLPRVRLYSFHVLGLLHPRKIIISARQAERLFVQTPRGRQSLEGPNELSVDASDVPVSVAGWDGRASGFILAIPGSIRRAYTGTLQVHSQGELLVPVVMMDIETAVSSVTGAEMPVSASPVEALMAQAVVARSFLAAAAPRHSGYDFCDTTHCQFLRSPAVAGSPADRAARRTSGLTLQSDGATVPCRYSASCGGHTDEREELGYRYQSVVCEACLINHYARRGHGLGLCQEGAIHLARNGWNYERILALYLPGARLNSATSTDPSHRLEL